MELQDQFDSWLPVSQVYDFHVVSLKGRRSTSEKGHSRAMHPYQVDLVWLRAQSFLQSKAQGMVELASTHEPD